MNRIVLKNIVIPHVVKVAFFMFVSGGLTVLLNNIAQLHLSPLAELVIANAINMVLAGIKKYSDSK